MGTFLMAVACRGGISDGVVLEDQGDGASLMIC